jgi:hypothetical protein
MKFFFPSKDTAKIIDDLQESLSGRKLGKMVSIDLSGELIHVTISKLGTSVIQFASKQKDSGQEWSVSSEKIAFSHKAFKEEVMEKLYKIVEGVGGTVL